MVSQTGWRDTHAQGYVLLMHQAVDGAVVGPSDYVFKYDKDVVRPSDIPPEFNAVLSGHIHRFQVLTKDLRGRPLATPIFYPGSIERTSFAEKDEKKGYLILELDVEDGMTRIRNWSFNELPTRPMVRVDLDPRRMNADFEASLRTLLDRLPKDGIISLRFHGPLRKEALECLRASSLRAIAPATMNVSVKLIEHQRRKAEV
jgi:exonuclease SbcD